MTIAVCGTAWRWSIFGLGVVGAGVLLMRCAVVPAAPARRDGRHLRSEVAGILSATALRTLALSGPSLRGSKRLRTFHFAVRPPIWTVSLNGKRLSRVPGTPARLKLGPGRHVLKFSHSAVRPLWVAIGAGEPGRTLRHRLRWRPGILQVDTVPQPADATFRFLSPPALARLGPHPAGLPLTVSFPQSAPLDSTVQIYAVGYQHARREVQLVPGQRRRLQVKLRRLRRRQGWEAEPRCDPLDDCCRQQ